MHAHVSASVVEASKNRVEIGALVQEKLQSPVLLSRWSLYSVVFYVSLSVPENLVIRKGRSPNPSFTENSDQGKYCNSTGERWVSVTGCLPA